MKYSLIVGNYGCGNYGDDLLLKSLLLNLPEEFEYKIMAPGKQYFPLPPAGLRSLFNFQSWRAISYIYRSNAVFFGGGGLFSTYEKLSFLIWGQVLIWSFVFRKPVFLLGQSFNSKFGFWQNLLFKNVTYLSVRDSQSQKFCPLASYSADLVFALDTSCFKFKKPKDSDFICISLRDFYKNDPSNLLNFAAYIKLNYLDKKIPVYFLPFKLIDSKLAKLFGWNLVDQSDIPSYIKFCKKLYAGRLHAMILAAIFNKPVTVLAYAPKMIGLAYDLSLRPLDLGKKIPPSHFNHSSLADQNVVKNFARFAKSDIKKIAK